MVFEFGINRNWKWLFWISANIKFDGLNRLKTIKIGNNSFTGEYDDGNDESPQSFHILNCESLESIQIGENSFPHFDGEFCLKNLPQLQSIQIGTIGRMFFANGRYSYNFHYSSFVIRGIELILNIECLDLPKLQSITLGGGAFEAPLSTIMESIE